MCRWIGGYYMDVWVDTFQYIMDDTILWMDWGGGGVYYACDAW